MSLVAAGILTAACTDGLAQQVIQTPVAPPGEVTIDLECDASTGTLSATITPWEVTMPSRENGKGIKWKLKSSKGTVSTADVDSVPNKPWPFKTLKKYKMSKDATTEANGVELKSGAAGTYPYTITTTCNLGGKTKTVVIDPDMIIPK